MIQVLDVKNQKQILLLFVQTSNLFNRLRDIDKDLYYSFCKQYKFL